MGWDELGIDQTGIIVIGDSFVRGTLADDTETIPAFLDSWYRDLTFFNFGIGGHGPLQYFLTYEKYGNAVAHDIVILVLYLQNDAYDVREFESRLAKAEGLNSQDLNWVKIRTFLLDKVLAEFKIYNLAVASAGNIRQAVERHEELAETLVDSVEKFAQALRQEGKRTLIVTIPGRDFYDAVEFPKRQHQSAISLTETSIDRLNIFANNNNLPILHLTEYFSKFNIQYENIYGWPDAHFNERGYYYTAAAISEKLKMEFNLDADVTPRFIDRTNFDPTNLACP